MSLLEEFWYIISSWTYSYMSMPELSNNKRFAYWAFFFGSAERRLVCTHAGDRIRWGLSHVWLLQLRSTTIFPTWRLPPVSTIMFPASKKQIMFKAELRTLLRSLLSILTRAMCRRVLRTLTILEGTPGPPLQLSRTTSPRWNFEQSFTS